MKHFANPHSCACCGLFSPIKSTSCRSLIEKHHIVEQANGGKNHPANIIFVCSNCHSKIHLNLIKPVKWVFSTKGYLLYWIDTQTNKEYYGPTL